MKLMKTGQAPPWPAEQSSLTIISIRLFTPTPLEIHCVFSVPKCTYYTEDTFTFDKVLQNTQRIHLRMTKYYRIRRGYIYILKSITKYAEDKFTFYKLLQNTQGIHIHLIKYHRILRAAPPTQSFQLGRRWPSTGPSIENTMV